MLRKIVEWFAFTILSLAVAWFLLTRPAFEIVSIPNVTMGQTKKDDKSVTGIDVSHYQGRVVWKSVINAGIKFVYVKATSGVDYIDPRFVDNSRELKRLGIPYGAYHFFEPKDDGLTQAKHYLSKVEVRGLLPPVLDIEIDQDVSADKIRKEVKQWLHEVEGKTGCRPIIYTYKIFWEKFLGSEFHDYPLWLADYAVKPSLPEGVDSWLFWQHSQKGTVQGIDGKVDMDVFAGDIQQLQSLLCKP